MNKEEENFTSRKRNDPVFSKKHGHYHMRYPLLEQLEVLIAVHRLLEVWKPSLAHDVLMCAKHGRNTWWDIWNYTTLT
jgi:hypothetical protein